jgi:Holliday junction resolvase RusA-like endonuclease
VVSALVVDVVGTPAPQGSHRGFINPNTQRVIITQDNKKTKPWRQDVVASTLNTIAARAAGWLRPTGPVDVTITFRLPRIKGHYRTGKYAHLLRDNAPTHSSTKPDVDKLARATLDALTNAGAFGDDAQVARLLVEKTYAEPGQPTGATITIAPLIPVPAAQPGSVDPSPAGSTEGTPTAAGTAPTSDPGALF